METQRGREKPIYNKVRKNISRENVEEKARSPWG